MNTFLGLPQSDASKDTAKALILPVPYEGTVTYRKGTAGGPGAIMSASEQVELYDEYLDCEPWQCGIATLPAVDPRADPEAMLHTVEQEVKKWVSPGRLVATIGGEHSLTSAAVAAHLDRYPDLGIIQFDAHADLRDDYEGSPWNHACVMSRVRESIPTSHVLQVGIRSLSAEEAPLVKRKDHAVLFARDIVENYVQFSDQLQSLPPKIYITFDVDVFDPSVIRSTGTPEPGGLDWYTILALLEQIFEAREVVGFDITELAVGDVPSAFTVARLIYRMIGFWTQQHHPA